MKNRLLPINIFHLMSFLGLPPDIHRLIAVKCPTIDIVNLSTSAKFLYHTISPAVWIMLAKFYLTDNEEVLQELLTDINKLRILQKDLLSVEKGSWKKVPIALRNFASRGYEKILLKEYAPETIALNYADDEYITSILQGAISSNRSSIIDKYLHRIQPYMYHRLIYSITSAGNMGLFERLRHALPQELPRAIEGAAEYARDGNNQEQILNILLSMQDNPAWGYGRTAPLTDRDKIHHALCGACKVDNRYIIMKYLHYTQQSDGYRKESYPIMALEYGHYDLCKFLAPDVDMSEYLPTKYNKAFYRDKEVIRRLIRSCDDDYTFLSALLERIIDSKASDDIIREILPKFSRVPVLGSRLKVFFIAVRMGYVDVVKEMIPNIPMKYYTTAFIEGAHHPEILDIFQEVCTFPCNVY